MLTNAAICAATSAEACTAAGVSSISVELDARFVPLIVQRIERARGEVAARADTRRRRPHPVG